MDHRWNIGGRKVAVPAQFAAFVAGKREEFVREVLFGRPAAVAVLATGAVAFAEHRSAAVLPRVLLEAGLAMAALNAVALALLYRR
mmetsp:Transcript_31412/g.88120  ORF Transcript_31412/g.88120 Transcript_31412/m.88120 type:complete len:86 (-) Transcript_31412:224-481(-)